MEYRVELQVNDKNDFEYIDKALKIDVMRKLFLKIWKQRPHRSELSGTSLGAEPLSIYFHHILPKEKYEIAAF